MAVCVVYATISRGERGRPKERAAAAAASKPNIRSNTVFLGRASIYDVRTEGEEQTEITSGCKKLLILEMV